MMEKLGPTLYQHVRAGFVQRGSSFSRWCSENSVHRPNARSALMGEWTGPKATEMVQRLVAASQGRVAR